jgi:hypothetical protein
MGQIFYSCAYDIEDKICCVYAADKFHANCYSYSGSVSSVHYLLRKKPYRIMWGGHEVLDCDEPFEFSRTEDLLGLSTYLDFEESDLNNPMYDGCLDKVKFIYDNSKNWKRIDVWEDAKKYFKWEITHCVKYENFLVNHTQKFAIDMTDFYKQSKSLTQDKTGYAIDPIPVLTETGGGAIMAFINGIAEETTEQLAGGWCGDLLQIVDKLPDGYSLLNCCFAEARGKVNYCYNMFGCNKEGFLIKNDNGDLFKGAKLNFLGERGPVSRIKVEKIKNLIKFIPVI